MPMVDAATGQLYADAADQSEILQVVGDALLTPVGSLEYRPAVGSILPLLQRNYGRPRRHTSEILASITQALAGYIPVEQVKLTETREGLRVDVADAAVFSVEGA